MNNALISIITPTTGKDSLSALIQSLKGQSVPFKHILLWDDKREDSYLYPSSHSLSLEVENPLDLNDDDRYSIVIPGSFVQGKAAGSALRAIGMMVANTPYITFADDDVWYEKEHLEGLLEAVEGNKWAYCKRKIWANEGDEGRSVYIGVDNFESVGDSPTRKVPYEMVDNNSMIFDRRLGTSAAVLYRETLDYNDDRLMYAFLKKYGGNPGKTNKATVNQICPERLIPMFKEGCTKEE